MPIPCIYGTRTFSYWRRIIDVLARKSQCNLCYTYFWTSKWVYIAMFLELRRKIKTVATTKLIANCLENLKLRDTTLHYHITLKLNKPFGNRKTLPDEYLFRSIRSYVRDRSLVGSTKAYYINLRQCGGKCQGRQLKIGRMIHLIMLLISTHCSDVKAHECWQLINFSWFHPTICHWLFRFLM